ncbi:hypothetical protein [Lachnoclostridium sp.]|uniref:hypothetical protein n=1 Tax=Lachnoclostridium sp. TaxID=2028282 RepID=UPI00289A03C4|nr:hypothetical protein [Lachnoclostridium sp.]
MKIRALVSFSGVLSMRKGQEMEYNNEIVLQDLLQARYIDEVETPTKGVKKNEGKRGSSK